MHDPETEHTLCAVMDEIIVTVQDLLEKRRAFPALVLLYSATDIFGSLLRPKSHPDTSGEDFRAWVDRYVLPGSSLAATADDLWATRCGLLHTNTPGSRSSRAGKAREVFYVRGDKEFATFAQRQMQCSGQAKVIVDIDTLFDAFIKAVMSFTRDVQNDATVRDTVFHHARSFFSYYSFKKP